MYKITDFKVGQTAYIELTGNARRAKRTKEELIKECTVESIGRKYVTANGIKFKEHDYNYGGLIEHTSYCIDYVLYPNRKAIEDKLEKEELILSLHSIFTGSRINNLSLDKLRKICEIINS